MSNQAVKELNENDNFFMIDNEDEDSMSDKYMTFEIANEVFGISIEYILEIIELQKITNIPDMPVFVKGVINLRGKIIPVIDLRLRFNINEKKYDDRTCIIVTKINNTPIGFIIDSVDEVVDITEDNIVPAPNFKTNSSNDKYIKGIGKIGEEIKIILDVEKIINTDSIKKINSNLNKQAEV